MYYTDDPESSTGPKSYTKHAGMFPDDEILGFDNRFFGIPDKEATCWAPCLRLCLEKCYEALQMRGYNRESMKGQNIALYNADIGTEFDAFINIFDDPDTWKAGRLAGMPSCGILSYHLGLKGPSFSIDTAPWICNKIWGIEVAWLTVEPSFKAPAQTAVTHRRVAIHRICSISRRITTFLQGSG